MTIRNDGLTTKNDGLVTGDNRLAINNRSKIDTRDNKLVVKAYNKIDMSNRLAAIYNKSITDTNNSTDTRSSIRTNLISSIV